MSRDHALALAILSFACALPPLKGAADLHACTAFCTVAGDSVLVGNNEDSDNHRTRMWFVAAEPERFGRMYVGYEDLFPQGGMNDQGLWFDGFTAPRVDAQGETLPTFEGNLIDHAMATCGSVDQVVQLMARYDRSFLEKAILMFADDTGDAVSIERNAIVRKAGVHFVQTNFHQSTAVAKPRDRRFVVASEMLVRAGNSVSPDLIRQILGATRQHGRYATKYSNIYNLTTRSMQLFEAGDMGRSITFQLDEELAKGSRVVEIAALFDRSDAAVVEAHQAGQMRGAYRTVTVMGFIAILAIAFGLLVLTWHGRRTGRSH